MSRTIAASIYACALAITTAHAEPGYRHFITGNEANVETPTRGLLVLQGGGTDVDENYARMGELGGGGDFVVLRASGADEYNEYVYALCKCDSVETLVFSNRAAASDPFVIETIRSAEALFIAGGDQSRYVRFWQDTPVGGTSAGMAILGEHVYAAMSDASLTAEHALMNPFHEDLTLARDFLALPALGNILTDQHLQERDRIGRTVAMLARLVHDGWTPRARAIAADRETSLHVDPATGTAEVFATADHETPYVYFMRTTGAPEVCEPGVPLTFRDVEVYRIGPGASFDIDAWSGEGGIAYTLDAQAGTLVSSRGHVY